MYILSFRLFSFIGYYKIFNIVPYIIQYLVISYKVVCIC